MKNLYLRDGPFPQGFFDGALDRIVELQREDGSIPWFDGGVVDPWNHTEAAMGLAVAGERARAEKAYAYLAETQLEDGSWHGQYGAAVPMDESHYTGDGNEKKIRDTNFCAYIATGVWHHHLLFKDEAFLDTYWPIVKSAVEFVLSLQSEHGDIRWAARDPHTPEDDALITGCSSIYKSLECAIRLAEVRGEPELRQRWAIARTRLGTALRDKPERFDRNWEEKSRFSMDWYYPVLTGVLRGEAARARIASKWETFVAEEKGCRCVIEQPWVTVAESCELAMALMNVGQTTRAKELFSWQHQWRSEDGAYWMGYQFKEEVPWPVERPAWTAGAVILAADALHHATPAASLFTDILPEEPVAEQTSKRIASSNASE